MTDEVLSTVFKLIHDREPYALSKEARPEVTYAALVLQLLSRTPEAATLQHVSRASSTWRQRPIFGQVYYLRLKATLVEVTAAALKITASGSSVPPHDTLYAWATLFLALPEDQRRIPDYVGFTTNSLHGRVTAAPWAHESSKNKLLVGKLCRWLGTGLEVFLVFTSDDIRAAVGCSDLPSRRVLGFAEQLAASMYGTQMRFGGMNVGPTGSSPPHPNTGPQMLAYALFDHLRSNPDAAIRLGFDNPEDLSPDAVKRVPVLTAVEVCRNNETSWGEVVAQLNRFVGGGQREEMTIRALMSAIGYVGGIAALQRGQCAVIGQCAASSALAALQQRQCAALQQQCAALLQQRRLQHCGVGPGAGAPLLSQQLQCAAVQQPQPQPQPQPQQQPGYAGAYGSAADYEDVEWEEADAAAVAAVLAEDEQHGEEAAWDVMDLDPAAAMRYDPHGEGVVPRGARSLCVIYR